MMTKEDMQTILDRLPDGTLIYVRHGDDAYPARPRIFEEECAQGDDRGLVLYLEGDLFERADHRNFPEEYSGTTIEQSVDSLKIAYSKNLFERLDKMQWSKRTALCLKNLNFVYFGDVAKETELSILRMPNMGRKTIDEIKLVLNDLGLSLGMKLPYWPPSDLPGEWSDQ